MVKTKAEGLPDSYYGGQLLSTGQTLKMLGICRSTLERKFLANKKDGIPYRSSRLTCTAFTSTVAIKRYPARPTANITLVDTFPRYRL